MISQSFTSCVIVCGTRTFDDYDLLADTLDRLTTGLTKPVFMQGGAVGADKLAERWLDARKKPYYLFRADWKTNKKTAGPIRNTEMVTAAKEYMPDAFCIAFWDGESDGTYDMIRKCKHAGVKTKVILYKELEDESRREVPAPKSGRRGRPARRR